MAGQLLNLKAWEQQLPAKIAAALAERVADDRYDVVLRRWFTAGRSGAPVALVLRSAPGDSEQLVLKFCDFDGRNRVSNLRSAWAESPGFHGHLAEPDANMIPLDDDWRAVFMRVAGGNVLDMVPLTDLYEDESFPDHCTAVVRSVVRDWNDDRAATATIDAGALIQDMMGRRGVKAEQWAVKAGIAIDEPFVRRDGWSRELPDPFAFVRGLQGKRKIEALIVGKAHGDLSGRDILVPRKPSVAAEQYVLIDYDRYSSAAPLARDPMHLLVALFLDRFGIDETPTRELAEIVVDPHSSTRRSLKEFRDLSQAIHATSAEFGIHGLQGEFEEQCLLSLIGVGLVHLGRKLYVPDEEAVKEWCFHVAALAAEKYLRNAPPIEPEDVAVPTLSPVVRAKNAPPDLVDRKDVFGELRDRLTSGSGGVVVVRGERGIGKTALVHAVMHEVANGAVRIHHHTVNPLIRLDAGTLTDLIAGRADSPAGRGRDSGLAGLEAVLQQMGDSRVVVVLDSAENLVNSHTREVDPDLDEALELLARRRVHRVAVVLVTNEDFASATKRKWPSLEEPILVRRLRFEHFFQYLGSLESGGRTASGDLSAETRLRLYERLQGNPRLAELAHAVVAFAKSGFDLAQLTERLLNRDPQKYLVRTVFSGLNPVQRGVLVALALFDTPVPASAVESMCGEEISRRAGKILTVLADNRIIRHSDGEYSMLPADGDVILSDIANPEERRHLYRKAARVLLQFRCGEPRGVNDLRVHFAELGALVRLDSPGEIFDMLWDINDVLRQWNCSELLLPQREMIRDRLDEFETMVNEDALGDIYVAISEFPQADTAYGNALGIALKRRDEPRKTKLHVNLATMYWQRNDTERARWYYELAHDEAVRLNRPQAQMGALEGMADCHRRRGRYQEAIDCAKKALAVPNLENYPKSAKAQHDATTASVAVALKLARWYGELGWLDDAERLVGIAESTAAEGRDDWLTASCLDGRADMLYDRGDYEKAISTAYQAVDRASRLRDGVTLLQARTTLCLAHLRMDRPRVAYAEIEAAWRYRRKWRSLVVLALYAMAARWRDDIAEAESRFKQLETDASDRMDLDGDDFAARDFLGLAQCGLRMDDRNDDLHDVVVLFDTTRGQTPPTPVLVKRLRFMLEQLEHYGRWPNRLRPVLDVLSDPTGRR